MTAFLSRSLTVAALGVSCLVFPAGAREAREAPATSAPGGESAASSAERVEITALREPLDVTYESAAALVAKVHEASGGVVELMFRIVDETPAAAPLRVSLEYGETLVPVPVETDNYFMLPPNPVALAAHARLVANRPIHGLKMSASLRPQVDAIPVLTLADVDRLIAGARAAHKALLPWHARLVTPTIRALRLCSFDEGARFALRDPAGTEHPLPFKEGHDIHDRPSRCAEIAPTDNAAERRMTVVTPKDLMLDFVNTGN